MRRIIPIYLILLFGIRASTVYANEIKPQVVIVNQVRGRECCDLGSLSALDLQFETLKQQKLPATFAIRYDALNDAELYERFTHSLSDFVEPALLLEITPSLAKDALVDYPSSTAQWYKAKNALLVGYTQDERKRLIDTAMERFFKVFGAYPKSTVAWMIDARSLHYLSSQYHISAHEITREQFSLDSYTLYGGPVHHPYRPSESYALIPSVEKTIMPLIYRQTVTDALYTYGDTTSTYTSQPNDYLAGKRDFSYFQSLLASALFSSKPYGFAVIGLETSMPEQIQREFIHQLEYVARLRDQNRIEVMTMSQHANFLQLHSQLLRVPMMYSREEKGNQAIWFSTPSYRLRLIVQHGKPRIDDLRIYDARFVDPYLDQPTKLANAYWMVPALIDGSRVFSEKKSTAAKTILNLANDFESVPDGLILPPLQKQGDLLTLSADGMEASYEGSAGKVRIGISVQECIITFATLREAKSFLSQIESRAVDPRLQFGASLLGTSVTLTPRAHTDTESLSGLIKELIPVASVPPNQEKSVLMTSNRLAQRDQNPIRVVLRLRDAQGLPVVTDPSEIRITPTIASIKSMLTPTDETDGQYFIDFTSDTPASFQATIEIGEAKWNSEKLRLVENCKTQWRRCGMNPVDWYWYFATKIYDRFREK